MRPGLSPGWLAEQDETAEFADLLAETDWRYANRSTLPGRRLREVEWGRHSVQEPTGRI